MDSPGEVRTQRKAELHAHLNGSIPPALVARLLPDGERLTQTTILTPVRTMEEYFVPWTIFRRLITSQTTAQLVLETIGDIFREDNVVYAELRNSIRHLAELNGISWSVALEWLLEGMDLAATKSGVDLRLIVSLTREHFSLAMAEKMLEAMNDVLPHPRLVGIDLTGDEDIAIPHEAARIFSRARQDLGMGVTIHAGENGSVENILWAINDCRAHRIGHGIAACQSEACLRMLIERNVCVEVCLTSNLMTSRVMNLDQHPVRVLDELHVPFVLCTDNPEMHQRTLSHEYELFSGLCPTSDALTKMFARQMQFAFGVNSREP